MMVFHGGCLGCTQQEIHPDFSKCRVCCYFDAEWRLKSQNNKPPTEAEIKRKQLKKKWRIDK